MTLQDMKYFIALAKHLHFGQAAQSCFVSQPTLSIAIQKIEERLKVILFERYKSTVKLTAFGGPCWHRHKSCCEKWNC